MGRTRFPARPSGSGKAARGPGLSVREFPEKARSPRPKWPPPAGSAWAGRAAGSQERAETLRTWANRKVAGAPSRLSKGQTQCLKSVPLVSQGPCPRAPAQGGRTMRGGRGDGDGAALDAPRDPGAPAPRLPSGARTRTLSCPSAGRWPFLLHIKALCCAHTKAAKTRFSSRPLGQIEGTRLNFQMALEA